MSASVRRRLPIVPVVAIAPRGRQRRRQVGHRAVLGNRSQPQDRLQHRQKRQQPQHQVLKQRRRAAQAVREDRRGNVKSDHGPAIGTSAGA
jgi:hypothetical protein